MAVPVAVKSATVGEEAEQKDCTADPVGAAGEAFTVIDEVVLLHPVVPSVKVKVLLPAASPVTIPPLVTDAIDGLLLSQVPPEVGESCEVWF